jgi:alkylation response protein AidB-like acyl-CoA dehydrogenase
VHTSAVTLPILTFGTDEQRSRFVPPLARGEAIGAFALTEPEAGSDAGSLRTAATPNGDGWSISGSKQWITNGGFGGTVLLFARTDQDTPGAKGVSAFILDGDQVRATREEEKLGLNSSSTVDLAIEGAEVGRDRLLHEEAKGFNVAMATLDGGRSSGGSSARRSPSFRRSSGSSPTWPPRSTRRDCWSTARPG